jgi:hypothetical protein
MQHNKDPVEIAFSVVRNPDTQRWEIDQIDIK